MSNKSTQKGHKLSVPRSLEDIQREYGAALMEAGQAQYLITIKQGELDGLNGRLKALNREADSRKKLDAIKAAAEGTTNV